MDIDLLIYPDLCDSFGHLNQASYLTLFERADPDEPLFPAALEKYYAGERDPATLRLIGEN